MQPLPARWEDGFIGRATLDSPALSRLVGHRRKPSLQGGQSCSQPAFSRLWPPRKAAAAKIGRPPSVFIAFGVARRAMTTGCVAPGCTAYIGGWDQGRTRRVEHPRNLEDRVASCCTVIHRLEAERNSASVSSVC